MEFKRYQDGDEKAILELFQKTFNRKMTDQYWNWRYKYNPSIKENLINLAWDRKTLAAHYAVSSTKLFVLGKEVNAALSMTTMTDPAYQGRGLFTGLAGDLFDSSKLDVIFGIPNENSLKGFVNKLNFELLTDIPMLESDISLQNFKKNENCEEIRSFDDRFDIFFKKVCVEYHIISLRGKEHLNWRFVDNPQNQYNILAFIENNKIKGYIVTKLYSDSGHSKGDIVDILVEDEIVLNELLSHTLYLLKDKGVSKVNTWFNDKNLNHVLDRYGFKENGQVFHFIVRDNREEKNESLYNFDNWYVTMSDIDLF